MFLAQDAVQQHGYREGYGIEQRHQSYHQSGGREEEERVMESIGV